MSDVRALDQRIHEIRRHFRSRLPLQERIELVRSRRRALLRERATPDRSVRKTSAR